LSSQVFRTTPQQQLFISSFPKINPTDWIKERGGLLFKDQRRTADPVGYEVDSHLHAVGNLNERNTTIHAVFLTVKRSLSFWSEQRTRFLRTTSGAGVLCAGAARCNRGSDGGAALRLKKEISTEAWEANRPCLAGQTLPGVDRDAKEG
jgi:hypothetical protein